MICFDNITGQRGMEAEEALVEKYKKEEVAKKLKHVAEDGTELPIRPRRNYAMSERSVKATSDRSARTSLSTTIMTDKKKADARKWIDGKRKAREESSQEKENEHPVNKKAKTLETKEEKFQKIKSVLRDLSSEIGENLNVTFDLVEEKEKEPVQEIALAVSETEVRTLQESKAKKVEKRKEHGSVKSGSSCSSSSTSSSSSSSSGSV